MRLADRMARIGTETAFEAAARARALEATGRSVIHLEIGEPDFDTPANIREAAQRALDEGWTHYGPFLGLPALREAIAARLPRRARASRRPPDRVVVDARRQADHVLRDPRPRRGGRRGRLPGPGLPDLRVDDPLRRRRRRCPCAIREENDFRLDLDELERLVDRPDQADHHQLAREPDRRRAHARATSSAIAELALRITTSPSSPTRSTAASSTTASTSRSRPCPAWSTGRSCSTASPRPTR